MSHINATSEKEPWVVDVENKYNKYDPFFYSLKMEKKSIYRWPNDLVVASGSLSRHRSPCLISFGPYHHGKQNLQQMEYHKERALYRILGRSSVPLSSFIDSLKGIEQEVRDSYDNLNPELLRHSFLQMMLFDGCFLLELIRVIDPDLQKIYRDSSGPYEPLFNPLACKMITAIKRDMLLLENQIPLLVLNRLLEVENIELDNDGYLHFFISYFLGFRFTIPFHGPSLHILDIYRKCLIMERTDSIISCCQPSSHLVAKGLKHMLIAVPMWVFWLLHGGIPKHEHIRSATRLHAAGIGFKKGKCNTGLKITFNEKNGVLTLPSIEVDDSTALKYMNLMAFERMHLELNGSEKVTAYVKIMEQLIDTAADVSLLCSQGILSNYLGSDEDAAKLFNTLSSGQIISFKNYILPLQKQLQFYVSSDWNMAIGYLKRDYFKNPWSVISLLAAIIVLVLTTLQTAFSGMSLKDGN